MLAGLIANMLASVFSATTAFSYAIYVAEYETTYLAVYSFMVPSCWMFSMLSMLCMIAVTRFAQFIDTNIDVSRHLMTALILLTNVVIAIPPYMVLVQLRS